MLPQITCFQSHQWSNISYCRILGFLYLKMSTGTYVNPSFIGISKWHVSSLKPLSMLLTISSWFIIVWIQRKLLQTIIVNTVYSYIYDCHFNACFYCVIDMCIMLLKGGWGKKWVLKNGINVLIYILYYDNIFFACLALFSMILLTFAFDVFL